MKISYQQLFILLLCFSHSISAITLYNKSNETIRFNVFPNDKRLFHFNIFPKKFGKIAPRSSCKINNLDPEKEYLVTFYDVYNYQNNKMYSVSGKTKKLLFN